jgi:hypothetical protein
MIARHSEYNSITILLRIQNKLAGFRRPSALERLCRTTLSFSAVLPFTGTTIVVSIAEAPYASSAASADSYSWLGHPALPRCNRYLEGLERLDSGLYSTVQVFSDGALPCGLAQSSNDRDDSGNFMKRPSHLAIAEASGFCSSPTVANQGARYQENREMQVISQYPFGSIVTARRETENPCAAGNWHFCFGWRDCDFTRDAGVLLASCLRCRHRSGGCERLSAAVGF